MQTIEQNGTAIENHRSADADGAPSPPDDGTALAPHGEATSRPLERTETRARMRGITPAVDIFESSEELLLVFDLPGVSEDAIDLRVERGDLSLTAEHAERGRVYRRAFTLPDTVDPKLVEAELDRGVLRVHLGLREDMRPRRIEVRSA
jgi:HSP20 family protein